MQSSYGSRSRVQVWCFEVSILGFRVSACSEAHRSCEEALCLQPPLCERRPGMFPARRFSSEHGSGLGSGCGLRKACMTAVSMEAEADETGDSAMREILGCGSCSLNLR